MAKRKTLLLVVSRLDDDKLNVWDGEMHQSTTCKSCRCGRQFKSKFKLKLHISRRIQKELEKTRQFDKIPRLSRFHCNLIDKAIESNVFAVQYYQKIALQDDAARQVEKLTSMPNLNYADKFRRESSDLLSDADACNLDQTSGNSLLGKPELTVSNSMTRANSNPESTCHRKVTISVPKEQNDVKLEPFVSDVAKARQSLESKKEDAKNPLIFSTKLVEMDLSSCSDVKSLLEKSALISSNSKTGVKSAQENTYCRKVMVSISNDTTLEPPINDLAMVSPLALSAKPVEIDIRARSGNRDVKSLLVKRLLTTSNSSTQAESDAESACCRNDSANLVEPCIREAVAKNCFSSKPFEMDLCSPSANRNLNCFVRLNISVENALGNPVGIEPSNNKKYGDATTDIAETSSPNIKRLKSDKAVSPATCVVNSVVPTQKSPPSDICASRRLAWRNRSPVKCIICGNSGGQDRCQVGDTVPLKKCNVPFAEKVAKPEAIVSNFGALMKANLLSAFNNSGEGCAEENSSRKGEMSAAGSSEQNAAGFKSSDDSNVMNDGEESYKHPALNNGFEIELNDDSSNGSSMSSVQNGIHSFPQTEVFGSKQCTRTTVMNTPLRSRKESNQNTEDSDPSVDRGFCTQNETPASSEERHVRLYVDAATHSPADQNCFPQIPCIDLTDDTDSELEDSKDVLSWVCDKCSISFLSEEMLQQHLLRTHMMLKCYVCGQWIWGTTDGQSCMLHTHLKSPRPCCETDFSKVARHAEVCSQHHFTEDMVLILVHHVGDEAPKSDCVSTNPSGSCSHGNVSDIITKHEGINSLTFYARAKRYSYKCSQCDNVFKKEEYLKVHVYKCHKGD